MNPSGNACLSKVWMQRPDVWIYTFELVIRLSKKWNSWPSSIVSLVDVDLGWTTGRRVASVLSERLLALLHSLKPRQQFLFINAPESYRLKISLQHARRFRQAHDFRCGLFLLMVSGEVTDRRYHCNMLEDSGRLMTLGVVFSFDGLWWGSIVHLIHLNTDSRRWGWREF